MTNYQIFSALVIGVLATGFLDVFGIVLNRLFGIPTTEWRYIGRWFARMRHLEFHHAAISKATPVRGELAIGWFMHYLIGIAFSLTYFVWVYVILDYSPTLLSGTLFGLITLAAPYLIMQPALGHGFFARKHSKPILMPTLSFLAHLTFGQSLYAFHYLLVGI